MVATVDGNLAPRVGEHSLLSGLVLPQSLRYRLLFWGNAVNSDNL
jgi:hypothetical protein